MTGAVSIVRSVRLQADRVKVRLKPDTTYYAELQTALVRSDCVRLDVAPRPSRHVFEAAPDHIERLTYRHRGVLMMAAVIVVHARRSSGRVQCGFVVDHDVLTRDRQFDSNTQRPMSMPVRRFQHDSTSDNPWIKRFEPGHARTNFFLDFMRTAHVVKTDLNRFRRHCPALRALLQHMSSHSSIFESWNDWTMIWLSTWVIPGAFAAALSAESRCSQVPTVPVSVAVSPATVTVM